MHWKAMIKLQVKIEGFRSVFFYFETFVKNLKEPQKLIAKIGFLNVKIKRFPSVN